MTAVRSGRTRRQVVGLALVVAILAAVLSIFAAPSPASARPAPEVDGAVGSIGTACASGSVDDSMLPVNRWTGAMSMHSRLHGGLNLGDIARSSQRSMLVGSLIDVGNMAWSLTTSITEFATRVCVLDRVGATVDNAAGALGGSILGSGLIALLVVLGIYGAISHGRKQGNGGQVMRRIGSTLLVMMILVATVHGAKQSTTVNGKFVPGTLSPGWALQTVDGIVSTAANSIAASVVCKGGDKNCAVGGADQGSAGYKDLGCAPYVDAMHEAFTNSVALEGIADNTAAATTPLLISDMWERSGLQMWKNLQYGSKPAPGAGAAGYTYGDAVYCRQLENQAGAPVGPVTDTTSQMYLTQKALGGNAPYGLDPATAKTNTLAWTPITSDDKASDRKLVGWAACATPHAGTTWAGAHLIHADGDNDGGTNSQVTSNCKSFFTSTSFDGNGDGGYNSFDWDESDDDVSRNNLPAATSDFLLVLHGDRQTSALPQAAIYLLSSFAIAVVFIMFAGAILGAKLMALFYIISFIFVLLIGLVPGAGDMGKVAGFMKRYVGLSVFAFGGQLILSLIALMSSVLVNVGAGMLPGGSAGLPSQLWTGMSPVIAVIALHHIFKQLRIPSPMKLSAGAAFGHLAAGGAVGAAGMMGAAELWSHAKRAGRAGKQVRALATRAGSKKSFNARSKVGHGGMEADLQKSQTGLDQTAGPDVPSTAPSPEATTDGAQGPGSPTPVPIGTGGRSDSGVSEDRASGTEEADKPHTPEEAKAAAEWVASLPKGERRALTNPSGVQRALSRLGQAAASGAQGLLDQPLSPGTLIGGARTLAGKGLKYGAIGAGAIAVTASGGLALGALAGAGALAYKMRGRPLPSLSQWRSRREQMTTDATRRQIDAFRQHQATQRAAETEQVDQAAGDVPVQGAPRQMPPRDDQGNEHPQQAPGTAPEPIVEPTQEMPRKPKPARPSASSEASGTTPAPTPTPAPSPTSAAPLPVRRAATVTRSATPTPGPRKRVNRPAGPKPPTH